MKSLSIRVSAESEDESKSLKNLLPEINKAELGLSLNELVLVSIENSMKLRLNKNLIEFIKGQTQTLSRLTIVNFEFGA